MSDCMEFPRTVEEFMEEYKVVDKEHVYSNGTEYVPIFRMKQWLEHEKNLREECEYVITKGKEGYHEEYKCSVCGDSFYWTQDRAIPRRFNYCRNCGRKVIRFIEKEVNTIRRESE